MGPRFGAPPGQSLNDRMKDEKPKSIKELPAYLKKVLRGTFRRLFYIFLLVWEAQPVILFTMIFMAVFNGVSPVISAWISANLLQSVVDRITDPTVDLISALVLQFAFILIRALIHTLNNTITSISSELVTNHIKIKIMNKAKTVDVGSFDMPDFYERMENANREAGTRPIHILSSAFSIVSNVITLFSFGAVLIGLFSDIRNEGEGKLAFTLVFAILFLVLSIASAAVSFHFRKKHFLYMRHRSKDRRQLSYYSNVLVDKDLVKELRLFNLSDLFIGRYNDVFKNYFKGIKKLIYKENSFNLVLSLLTAACNSTLIYMIATNIKEIKNYSLYSSALSNISGAVSNLISVSATIYEGTLFIDNLLLFMNETQTIKCSEETPIPIKRHVGHTIELKHVGFRYPGGSRRQVLNDINLTLEPGDTVVLVGLNGAGKTTLIKLLTRLYDPTEGEILLDGDNIKKYDPKELYKIFGIIFQDFGKYAVTAGENISFGDIEKGDDKDAIKDAAINSGADEFISRLSRNYDTPMMRYFESDGAELSIGQWQKLSVARAFYSDSDILILDEPTASLDPLAEQEIFNQFDRLRKDKTTVFVSHRLSSATVANKIVVLKQGEIVEMGNHRELMAKKGEYYTLFSTQASRYISNDDEKVRTDVPDRPNRPEQPEFSERPNRPELPEQPEFSDRPERPERPDLAEGEIPPIDPKVPFPPKFPNRFPGNKSN